MERAKEDGAGGRRPDSPNTATVPEEFEKALEAAGLTEKFSKLKSQERYSMLHRSRPRNGQTPRPA